MTARPLPDEHDRTRRRIAHDTYAPYETRAAVRAADNDGFEAWLVAVAYRAFIILAIAIGVVYVGVEAYLHAMRAIP